MNEVNRLHSPSHSIGAPANSFNVQKVLNAVRCWWKIAAPIALLLAVAAGGIVFYLHQPTYTAEAWILIKEKPEVILRSLETDSKRFIYNQMEFIRSHRLLSPLAQKPAILATPELKDEQDVASALGRKIQIRQRGLSDIYIVSFTSTSAEKAELIVKEVTGAYLGFYTKSQSEQENRIIKLLEEQRAARYEEMNQLRDNVRSLSLQLKGIDPFRGETKDDERGKSTNPFASLQESIIQYEVDQEYLSANIKAEEQIQAEQTTEVPTSEVEKQVFLHPRHQTLLGQIESSRQKLADFERIGKNLQNNPAYKLLQSDLATSKQTIETLKTELRKEIKEAMEKHIRSQKADKLNEMKSQYSENDARLKIIKEKFKQSVGSAQQYTGNSLELEFRRAKLEQVTRIHDEISGRILAITTEQRAPDRVEMFKESSLPLHPDELVPWKKIGMGAGAAFLVPFALVIGWEQLFRRVNSRSQLENSHQISVVGEITSLPSKLRGSAAANRSTEREVMLFEESIDGLRTYLMLTESLRELRVLAITSACSKEGKTSLSAQLAVSIARASGERVLIIDGDMRAPDIHKIFDKELGPGLAEVLRNECPIEEAIETGFNEKMHILTAGQLKGSPHRLLGSDEFPLLLEKLCSIYRYIIVDTPPILSASESLVMARAADAAVLCVRRDYSRIDQVQEAFSRMAAAGITTAGAVLNGIPIKHYAYKYGSYTYSSPVAASA